MCSCGGLCTWFWGGGGSGRPAGRHLPHTQRRNSTTLIGVGEHPASDTQRGGGRPLALSFCSWESTGVTRGIVPRNCVLWLSLTKFTLRPVLRARAWDSLATAEVQAGVARASATRTSPPLTRVPVPDRPKGRTTPQGRAVLNWGGKGSVPLHSFPKNARGCWRLGGWRLAVDGPLARSLRAGLSGKKNLVPLGPPCHRVNKRPRGRARPCARR